MEEKKTNKIKKWFNENKESIVRYGICGIGFCGIGFSAGSLITRKLTEDKCAISLRILESMGVLKLVDPSNGNVVDVKEACEIVRNMN